LDRRRLAILSDNQDFAAVEKDEEAKDDCRNKAVLQFLLCFPPRDLLVVEFVLDMIILKSGRVE